MTAIPTAADGTSFDAVTCRRAGGYWVGPKGREYKFGRFEDAVGDPQPDGEPVLAPAESRTQLGDRFCR